jgi:hypothetical protein
LLLQEQDKNNLALELRVLHDRLTNAYRRLVLIASNEEEDTYQLKIDKINAEACACEVALAITKLTFEGPIILKGFSAYFCGDDDDDDLAQLELKNQRLPMPFRPPEFYAHYSSQISQRYRILWVLLT